MNLSKSSGNSPLRVPWIWFLIPCIIGYLSAEKFTSWDSLPFIWWLFLPQLSHEFDHGFGTPLLFSEVSGLQSAISLNSKGRKPTPAHLSLPPRELILEVQIFRIFNSSKGSKTISGLGLIQGIQQIRQDLIGKRIHFRLNPLPSGQECLSGDFLKATGILYPIKDKQVGTFHKHLVSRGIHYEFRRGQFIEKTKGVGSFKVFCHNANKRFEEFLRRGAEPDDETAAGIGVANAPGQEGSNTTRPKG